MIALTSLFHANSNKTNNIQSDHQQVGIDVCNHEVSGYFCGIAEAGQGFKQHLCRVTGMASQISGVTFEVIV